MKKLILIIIATCLNVFLFSQQSSRKQQSFTPQPLAAEQLDFASVKSAPEYKGGKEAMYKFIYANMQYPKDAKAKGIEGDVLMKFTVGKDGSISKIKVIEGIYPSIDVEAVRVVKLMPKWIPGKYGDNGIVSTTSLIIGFHLSK